MDNIILHWKKTMKHNSLTSKKLNRLQNGYDNLSNESKYGILKMSEALVVAQHTQKKENSPHKKKKNSALN
jgi:hypothetical protein